MQLVQKLIFVRKKHDEGRKKNANLGLKKVIKLMSIPTNFPIQIIPTFAFIREWKTQKK